jgi:hypothetical protein
MENGMGELDIDAGGPKQWRGIKSFGLVFYLYRLESNSCLYFSLKSYLIPYRSDSVVY